MTRRTRISSLACDPSVAGRGDDAGSDAILGHEAGRLGIAGGNAWSGHRLTSPFAAGDFQVQGEQLGIAERYPHPLRRYSAAAAIGYSDSVTC